MLAIFERLLFWLRLVDAANHHSYQTQPSPTPCVNDLLLPMAVIRDM